MTLLEVLTAYINLLWEQFQYDIGIFSQPWMYWWILIPAIAYLMFFIFKWMVLLSPIISIIYSISNAPFKLVSNTVKNIKNN